MGVWDGFRDRWAFGNGKGKLKTRQTDEFADLVLLELKSVSANAVRAALEATETRYMRSILDESYFGLESMVITPRDREIARRFEEFLSTHESVDPDFRRNFFRQVVQPEYRSTRGSLVRVGSDFAATVQLGTESLDPLTDEEGFQISLRGRRLLFDAVASLSGPFRREAPTGTAPQGTPRQRFTPAAFPLFVSEEAGRAGIVPVSPATEEKRAMCESVLVQLTDGRGVSQHRIELPVVVGREPVERTLPAGWTSLRVDATYTSRQQLVLFDLLGTVHYALAAGSSLSVLRADGVLLERSSHYALLPHERVTLHFGVDPDQLSARAPLGHPADFAVLELLLDTDAAASSGGTPRPRAVP